MQVLRMVRIVKTSSWGGWLGLSVRRLSEKGSALDKGQIHIKDRPGNAFSHRGSTHGQALRIEYEGAFYHISAQGNGQRMICNWSDKGLKRSGLNCPESRADPIITAVGADSGGPEWPQPPSTVLRINSHADAPHYRYSLNFSSEISACFKIVFKVHRSTSLWSGIMMTLSVSEFLILIGLPL